MPNVNNEEIDANYIEELQAVIENFIENGDIEGAQRAANLLAEAQQELDRRNMPYRNGFGFMNPEVLRYAMPMGGGPVKKDKKSLEEKMKERHLNGAERRRAHKPKSDWRQSGRGEVCRNASSLPIDDLVIEFNLN